MDSWESGYCWLEDDLIEQCSLFWGMRKVGFLSQSSAMLWSRREEKEGRTGRGTVEADSKKELYIEDISGQFIYLTVNQRSIIGSSSNYCFAENALPAVSNIYLKMSFELDTPTAQWLLQLHVLSPQETKPGGHSHQVDEQAAKALQNGTRIALIVQHIYRERGLPPPQYLSHLKVSGQTAAQLYNWNYLNEALKKLDSQIDPQTKNLIINGDRPHLAITLRQLRQLDRSSSSKDLEDSLDNNEPFEGEGRMKQETIELGKSRESLTLSRSEDAGNLVTGLKRNEQKQLEQLERMRERGASKEDSRIRQPPRQASEGDLLEFVLSELMQSIGISRQQALTLLEDNNKYLAHVLVKGVRGSFQEIEQLMERWFRKVDFIVQKMGQQNDMCFFFLQVLKPTLLSKSEEVAQWGCRLLSRIAHELANQSLLPLAYDWFVREAGGLSTTMLALARHPKLNQHVVGFILQFSRFNVAEVFTVELKKITNQDQLSYVRFLLLILQPLVESKQTAEELLNAGAIDYWVESCLKGAEQVKEGVELRLYCLQLLAKLWRAYPVHLEETLDKVTEIMTLVKRGIREGSQIVRFTLLELLFGLLDQFATKKNPYASVVYKKLTFLFIQNHQELNTREFMLRNFTYIIKKYQSIPVDIFLEPFVKQIKIKENESYFLNIFDLEFIAVAVSHPKLKVDIGLEFLDLLAKIKLNNYDFTLLADQAMETLLDRFLGKDLFLQYTAKLVKVSLAKFYNTYKHRKTPLNDHERLLAQKRAEIVNFVISLLERGTPLAQPFQVEEKHTGTMVSTTLYDEIKDYTIQVKIQIQRVLNSTHRGIERILEMFPNVQGEVREAMEEALLKEETESNMTSQPSKEGFRLPKIEPKYLSRDRDETSSQQSNLSQGTRYSQKTKQEFPQQDYTKFAEEDEQKFLKEHGIGFKKKQRARKPVSELQVDPKVQEQIMRTKLRKEEEERKKAEQQDKISRRKELLKNKIQKELEQRNIMQGVKGYERDVEVRVLFEENQINEKILDDRDEEQLCRNISLSEEETRDSESVRLVLKRHAHFLRKLFNRYSCSKVGKKDYFEEDNEAMVQIDLVRMCKEKNLEKSKPTIVELLKQTNDKNIKNISLQNFYKFLEAMTVYLYMKEKWPTHQPMGDLTRNILKRLATGQNFKLEQEEDHTTKALSEKVKYNPHIDLPEGYKKIYERVYDPKKECSFPTKKAISNDSFTTCYEVVNELLFNIFKFNTLEEEVRFYEEARVVKKNVAMPPRAARREKEKEEEPVSLLEDREVPSLKGKRPGSNFHRTASNRAPRPNNPSVQKQNSKPKPKILNAAEKKKQEQQQSKRQKREQEEQEFKRRQLQIKKRFQKLQQEKEREQSKQKQQKQMTRDQEEERIKREKERKERQRREQKEKLQRYKREKEEKEKEEKQKEKEMKTKEEEDRRQKLKAQMKKQEGKRKEEAEKNKKERELSEQKNKKKKEEQQKKAKVLRETVQRKLQTEKEKYQVQKLYKELMKNIFQEKSIQAIFNNYKDQLKNLYSYGKEYNEYRLGDTDTTLEGRGWNTICQQFDLADPATANGLIKANQKENGRPGFSFQDFQEMLLSLSAPQKQLEGQLDDYEQAKETSGSKLQQLLKRLRIPRDKQTMKDYFVGLKSSLKKREEVQVVGPGGQKETWEVEQK